MACFVLSSVRWAVMALTSNALVLVATAAWMAAL
jgi:hypothetical protein